MLKNKRQLRERRHKRIRSKIVGTSKQPRLSIFRSNKHIFTQLINDIEGKTIVSTSDLGLKTKETKSIKAFGAGELIADKAKELKIKKAVFDRGGYKYHGIIKSIAEGARKGGLKI